METLSALKRRVAVLPYRRRTPLSTPLTPYPLITTLLFLNYRLRREPQGGGESLEELLPFATVRQKKIVILWGPQASGKTDVFKVWKQTKQPENPFLKIEYDNMVSFFCTNILNTEENCDQKNVEISRGRNIVVSF